MAVFIIGIGYCTIMWGKIKEEETNEDYATQMLYSSYKKVPLLQEDADVYNEP